MSAPKFTPGPWWWDHGYTNNAGEPTWSLVGDGGYGILSCDEANAPQNCTAANAHLIAAAPELYEALDAISSYAREVPAEVWDQVRAALAKAVQP